MSKMVKSRIITEENNPKLTFSMRNNFCNRNGNHKQIFSKLQSYSNPINKFQRIYKRINIYLYSWEDWKSLLPMMSQAKIVLFGDRNSFVIMTKSWTVSAGASRMGMQLTNRGGKITDPLTSTLTILVKRL